jgi:hypothetical protein
MAGWLDGWIARWRNSKTALFYFSCKFASIRGQLPLFNLQSPALHMRSLPMVEMTRGGEGLTRKEAQYHNLTNSSLNPKFPV